MATAADNDPIRVTVTGPDFDTGELRSTTIVVPAIAGDAETALADQGLTVSEEDGQLLLDEPFMGTPHFKAIGTEYDYYGDLPVIITGVEVENDRMPKEIFFIPALLLLAGLVLIQRPRATQPAF